MEFSGFAVVTAACLQELIGSAMQMSSSDHQRCCNEYLKRQQGYCSSCVEAFISSSVANVFKLSSVVTVVFKGSSAVRQRLNCRMASHGYIWVVGICQA